MNNTILVISLLIILFLIVYPISYYINHAIIKPYCYVISISLAIVIGLSYGRYVIPYVLRMYGD